MLTDEFQHPLGDLTLNTAAHVIPQVIGELLSIAYCQYQRTGA